MKVVLFWGRGNTDLDMPHCTVTMTLKLDKFSTAKYLEEWVETTSSSNIPGILESTITTSLPGVTLTLALTCDNACCFGTVRKTIRPMLTAKPRSEIIDDERLKGSNRKVHGCEESILTRRLRSKEHGCDQHVVHFFGNERQRITATQRTMNVCPHPR